MTQFGDDAYLPAVRLGDEIPGIVNVPINRIDGGVAGNVVSIVLQRRGIKRQQPDGG